MATRYDILPEAQRLLLPALASLHELGFVLYGGTAVALRLGHRSSVDFDFFTDRSMDRRALVASVPVLADAETLQDEPDTWTVLARAPAAPNANVKLSFFSRLAFGRVGTPSFDDKSQVLMASLDDLLGLKLKVLLQRVEEKDYADIAEMLGRGQTLGRGLGAARALFRNFPAGEALKALTYFDGLALQGLSTAHRSTLVDHSERIKSVESLAILSRRLGID